MITFLRPILVFFVLVTCFFSNFSAEAVEISEPVALYLTWQRNPESTMTIQWITGKENSSDMIDYKTLGAPEWQSIAGSHTSMPEGYPYFIHRTELTELKSGSDYYFRIGNEGPIFKFRTMPAELSTPIRFVSGGDVYHDTINDVVKMNVQAAKTDPYFALVGGDIAYVSAKYSLLQRWGFAKEKLAPWLEWLKAWKQTMITPGGHLIPLIPCIGNHDVMGRFGQTPDQARMFYALFPFPGPQGYNVIDFGHYLSLVILDSGHTHPISGAQTRWLSKALSARTDVPHKFAMYHVGAYPSARKFSGEIHHSIRKHWVHEFEQYGLNIAFEHHDHTYKRTHPIRRGQIDPKGIVYIGDGAWGVEEPRKPHSDRWYLAKSAALQNVTVTTLDQESRYFRAIDFEGHTIDEYTQHIGK